MVLVTAEELEEKAEFRDDLSTTQGPGVRARHYNHKKVRERYDFFKKKFKKKKNGDFERDEDGNKIQYFKKRDHYEIWFKLREQPKKINYVTECEGCATVPKAPLHDTTILRPPPLP
eukprot:3846534-Rhodomonas_salina.1